MGPDMEGTADRRYVVAPPVVIDRRKKKKLSKNISDYLRSEMHLTKAAKHTLDASAAGLAVYQKRRKKVRRKRTGDFSLNLIPHVLDGSAVATRKMSLVPADLFKSFYSKRNAKRAGKGLKTASRFISRTVLP